MRNTPMHLPLPTRLGAMLAVAVLAAACSGSAGTPAGTASGGASGSTIQVTNAWARTSPSVAGAGAAYMTITNTSGTADTLVSASSPAAKSVEVHETVVMGASAAPSGGMGGGMASPAASGGMGSSGGSMMGMQKVDKLEIPANGSVELKPGSYHIMLIDLAAPLATGQKIDITLNFEKAGAVTVTAEVKEG